jgi:hypothetical protein
LADALVSWPFVSARVVGMTQLLKLKSSLR